MIQTEKSPIPLHNEVENVPHDPIENGNAYSLDEMEAAVRYNNAIVDLVVKALPIKADLRVAEYGAGTATLSRLLASRLKSGSRVDVWEPYLTPRLCEASAQMSTLQVWPQIAGYDSVFSSNVIEHLVDDQGAVNEMAHVLRKSGTLILYVPALASLFGPMDTHCGHQRRYSVDDLEGLCRNAGLIVLRSGYSDPLGGMITWILNRIGSGVKVNRSKVSFYDRWLFPISQIMTPVLRRHYGKNAWVVAMKWSSPMPGENKVV